MTEERSFGDVISDARKKLGISQKQLAIKIKREDGEPISAQYLNDIEHDRRSPSSDLLVQQFAKVLKLDPDYLFYLSGKLPTNIPKNLSPDAVSELMVAFRRQLKTAKK